MSESPKIVFNPEGNEPIDACIPNISPIERQKRMNFGIIQLVITFAILAAMLYLGVDKFWRLPLLTAHLQTVLPCPCCASCTPHHGKVRKGQRLKRKRPDQSPGAESYFERKFSCLRHHGIGNANSIIDT